LLLVLTFSGCSGKSAVKTAGIVTLDGQPLEGVEVTFHPEDEKGKVATGETGSDGRFRLSTRNPFDGALPGKYKITVALSSKVGDGGEGAPMDRPDQMKKMMEEQARKVMQDRGGKAAKPKTTKTVIPQKYVDVKSTPLHAEIPAGGDIELALSSKGG
jgi:hypothetical protein